MILDYYETPKNLKLRWDSTTDSLIAEITDSKPNGIRFVQIDVLRSGEWVHAPSGVRGTLPEVLEALSWPRALK